LNLATPAHHIISPGYKMLFHYEQLRSKHTKTARKIMSKKAQIKYNDPASERKSGNYLQTAANELQRLTIGAKISWKSAVQQH
jgi:hypothetical protein